MRTAATVIGCALAFVASVGAGAVYAAPRAHVARLPARQLVMGGGTAAQEPARGATVLDVGTYRPARARPAPVNVASPAQPARVWTCEARGMRASPTTPERAAYGTVRACGWVSP